MIIEKRKNMIRKRLLPAMKRARGASGSPKSLRAASRTEGIRESTSIATDAASQLAEYSTRMCARRTENKTIPSIRILNAVVTLRSRSILSSRSRLARRAMEPAIEFQNVHENSQEHVKNIVEGLHRGDGGTAREARPHRAGDLFKAESA